MGISSGAKWSGDIRGAGAAAGAWLLRCAMCVCMHVQSGTADLGFVELRLALSALAAIRSTDRTHFFHCLCTLQHHFAVRFNDYNLKRQIAF